MSSHTILVTGATGTQGGAVARCLLKKGCVVHALVRDPTSPASLALKSLGAVLFQGAFDNHRALAAATIGCTGLFLNLTVSFEGKSELEHGQIVLAAARDAGVRHVVYSSGTGIDQCENLAGWNPKGIIAPHILDKCSLEEEVRKGGWETWTILRPGNFMTNFLMPSAAFMFPDLITKGLLVSAYKPDTLLLLINPEDVGPFATAAFLDPRKFGSQEIEIVGDVMGVEQVVDALAKATGKTFKPRFLTEEEVRASVESNPAIAGQTLLADLHKWIDAEKVRTFGVDTGTFAEFLEEKRERVNTTFAALP